jgi:hypothetical protein
MLWRIAWLNSNENKKQIITINFNCTSVFIKIIPKVPYFPIEKNELTRERRDKQSTKKNGGLFEEKFQHHPHDKKTNMEASSKVGELDQRIPHYFLNT